MKGLVLTHIGIEDISADEIKQLISASDVENSRGKVTFSCNSYQDLVDLCYRGRTFTKVILLLSQFQSAGLPSPDNIPDVKEWITESVVLDCERFGTHDFTSADIQPKWNKALQEKYDANISYKTPQTIFFLVVDDKECYFGIDFSGVDLGKRDYRIFLGRNALKGNIAASLLQIADYNTDQSLLDPFCRHGIIPIEAALFATNKSCHKFNKEKFAFTKLPNVKFELSDEETDFKGTIISMDDNFKHVSASKKNAKIAGVVKDINFSRTDLKWLDAKFGKRFIDRIIAFPPQLSKYGSEKKFEQTYHEIFYQADFILKENGKICLVMRKSNDLVKNKAEQFKFSLDHERIVMQGQEELTVLVFSK